MKSILILVVLFFGKSNANQGTGMLASLPSTVSNWTNCLQNLEDRVDALIARYNTYINRFNDTQTNHFNYPGNLLGMSYNDAQQFCFFRNQVICTYDEIFPNGDNIPTITGLITGGHWTPISDEYNDWTFIGTTQSPGIRHIETYGVAEWGLGFFETHFGEIKGNIFCCPDSAP